LCDFGLAEVSSTAFHTMDIKLTGSGTNHRINLPVNTPRLRWKRFMEDGRKPTIQQLSSRPFTMRASEADCQKGN
jgi:hypothetical protein